jgi:hypothetical protein
MEKRFIVSLSPPSSSANYSVNHQAKPKVDNHAQIDAQGTMAGDRRQRRHKQEIHYIAQNDCQQGLKEVQSHR